MSQYKQYHLYTDLGDILVNLDTYYNNIVHGAKPTDCWSWTGPTHRQGYGMMGAIRKSDDKRIMVVAHRIGGRLKAKSALATTDTVVRTCSNPACLNPRHIQIGDLSLRNRIAVKNGRMGTVSPKQAGVVYKQNRTYKYTEKEILFLRNSTTEAIAKQYGVTRSRACNMRWYARSQFKWLK